MPRSTVHTWLALSTAVATFCAGCVEEPFPNAAELEQLRGLYALPSTPPRDPTNRLEDDPRAVALGTRLFHDKQVSGCGEVSCESCHTGEGRTVSEATGQGCNGQRTLRNPPSLLNTAYNRWFMWDGRADRLWSQAILPLTNPAEMASTPAILRNRLESAYASEYFDLFGLTPADTQDDALLANFGKLVAAYERNLNRTVAPFDETVQRFIAAAERGDAEKDDAYLGLKTFLRKGQCIACHKGPALTDHDFHNIGVADNSEGRTGALAAIPPMLDWTWNAAGTYSDETRGAATNRLENLRTEVDTDRKKFEGAFRTPSLRNVSVTAPYMHTGAFKTLEDVVEFYNRGGDEDGTYAGVRTETVVQLDLTDEEKAALVHLLESMTGER